MGLESFNKQEVASDVINKLEKETKKDLSKLVDDILISNVNNLEVNKDLLLSKLDNFSKKTRDQLKNDHEWAVTVQIAIKVLGYYKGTNQTRIDGRFGENSINAIKAFQADFNKNLINGQRELPVNGVAGPRTLKAIKEAINKKINIETNNDINKQRENIVVTDGRNKSQLQKHGDTYTTTLIKDNKNVVVELSYHDGLFSKTITPNGGDDGESFSINIDKNTINIVEINMDREISDTVKQNEILTSDTIQKVEVSQKQVEVSVDKSQSIKDHISKTENPTQDIDKEPQNIFSSQIKNLLEFKLGELVDKSDLDKFMKGKFTKIKDKEFFKKIENTTVQILISDNLDTDTENAINRLISVNEKEDVKYISDRQIESEEKEAIEKLLTTYRRELSGEEQTLLNGILSKNPSDESPISMDKNMLDGLTNIANKHIVSEDIKNDLINSYQEIGIFQEIVDKFNQ